MHSKTFLAGSILSVGFAAAQTGELGDAERTTDNPVGVVYKATLPDVSSTTVRGSISGTAGEDGEGVVFEVDFTGFYEDGAPFQFHLHDAPVPADGNCTSTLAHLDPFIRGADPPCDSDKPETCEVGDLSGKYGEIEGVSGDEHYTTTFHDFFTSTKPGLGAFFGNRSVVIHDNEDRISCANFVLKDGSQPPPSSTGIPNPTGTGVIPHPTGPTGNPPPPPFDAAASRTGVASFGVVMAAVIGLLL